MFATLLPELAVKASLVLLAGFIVARWGRLSAAIRHLVLFTALIGAIVVPVASLLLAALDWSMIVPLQRFTTAGNDTPPGATQGTAGIERPSFDLDALLSITLAFWAIGAAICLCRVLLSQWALARLLRRALPVKDPHWLRLLEACCSQLRVARPRLLVSSSATIPFACGVLQPSILIPRSAEAWDDERKRDVLLHELAHVARRDALTHLLARIARALHFWNPIAVLVERQLGVERECACDDRVLRCVQRADAYATTLVEIAATPAQVIAAPLMTHLSQLEQRITALFDSTRPREELTRARSALIIMVSLCAGLPLAALKAATPQMVPVAAGTQLWTIDSPHAAVEVVTIDGSHRRRIIATSQPDETLRRALLVDGVERPWDAQAEDELQRALILHPSSPARHQTELIPGPDAINVVTRR